MARVELLRECMTPARYNDAVVLVGRFVSHFVPRSEDQHALVMSEVGGACDRHTLSVVGLAAALTEMMEAASTKKPYLPPTGEIIARARSKTDTLRAVMKNDMQVLRGAA